MSVLFNNAQAYESNPWNGPTTALGSFTLAVRVYTANITTSGQVAIDMDGSGGSNQLIQLDTGTTPPAWNGFLVNDAHSAFPGVTGPSNVTINTWYHLCLTYDGTTITLYVDGVSVGTNAPGAVTRTGNWAYFGAPVNWIGSVQDAVAYNAALTVGEIQQLYRGRLPARRTNLLAHVPMLSYPGLENYAGSGATLAINGTASSAGLDTAGIPWGTAATPQTAVHLTSSTAAIASAQLESAAAVAGAVATAADVAKGTAAAGATVNTQQLVAVSTAAGAVLLGATAQTATMLAGAANQTLTAADVQTAKSDAVVSQFLAASVQSASAVAVAQLLSADVQSGFMLTSGGGSSGAGRRNQPTPRRPLVVLSRRGVRAR